MHRHAALLGRHGLPSCYFGRCHQPEGTISGGNNKVRGQKRNIRSRGSGEQKRVVTAKAVFVQEIQFDDTANEGGGWAHVKHQKRACPAIARVGIAMYPGAEQPWGDCTDWQGESNTSILVHD